MDHDLVYLCIFLVLANNTLRLGEYFYVRFGEFYVTLRLGEIFLRLKFDELYVWRETKLH